MTSEPQKQPSVHGTVAPKFERVREVLQRNLDGGADLGASVAVMLDGELVVDLWGGSIDPEGTKPYRGLGRTGQRCVATCVGSC